ncbi:MAG TPA: MFS transporter [Chloroflexota bacterium]|nr:MFS transporter [Chloroflexota bacterium]
MPESGGVFSPPHRALSVGILVSISAIAAEGMAVATVMPAAATELGGLDGYGWAFSAFMLMSLIGAIAAGRSADRGSVTVPARLGFASFALGLVVAGVAPNWPVLLLGRGLQGFGGGSLSAVAYMAVARGYPESLRPRLLALLSSAWVVPALLGPALAGQVAEHASWRWVFLGILPLMAGGALMLMAALARLPAAASEPGVHDRGRLMTAARLAVGIGLVLWAAGWTSLGPSLLLAALGVVLAAPALRALLPVGTFTAHPGLPAAVAIRGLLAFGFFGCEALIPLGLATVRSLPPSVVGLALTAGALLWVAGSWLQDRDEARTAGAATQRAVRVRVGLVLILVGIGSVAVVILSASLPVVLGVAAWGVAGLGMGLAYPGSTLVALNAPGPQSGLAAASLLVAETVGVSAGAGAGGTLIAVAVHLDQSLPLGLGWAFVLMAGAVVVALAPAIRLVREPARAPEDVSRSLRFARSVSAPDADAL